MVIVSVISGDPAQHRHALPTADPTRRIRGSGSQQNCLAAFESAKAELPSVPLKDRGHWLCKRLYWRRPTGFTPVASTHRHRSLRLDLLSPRQSLSKEHYVELMNQPFNGQLGTLLLEQLNSSEYHTLNIAVAFAKNSGVLRIKDALQSFRERSGRVNVYVGVDLGGTSYEALTALRLYTDSLSVVHSESGQTFHSKVFQFVGLHKSLMIVGSHNLTGGGLWTNFESSVHIYSHNTEADAEDPNLCGNSLFHKLSLLDKSIMSIRSQDIIDRLLKHGYVSKEVSTQVRRGRAVAGSEVMPPLFGRGVPAQLPRSVTEQESPPADGVPPLASPAASSPVDLAAPIASLSIKEEETIWFETRRMTGGSRNILDLSMKSLIERGSPTGTSFDMGDPRFMRGGVEFFGLNPADTDQRKSILINFEGVDYSGNTILFPLGESSNGTWRLQIKGTSSQGQKITDAFRSKGVDDYLVRKIITFTKIEDDYYFMSVFAEDELEKFRSSSRILARNGSTTTAKQLGLL